MVDSFREIHERNLFDKYESGIKCPKCKSEDIIIKLERGGFFSVFHCKKCSYKG